jgi:hypothetical protein
MYWSFKLRSEWTVLGRGHTKETGNRNATAISEKRHRLEAGNWFPDYQAHTEEIYV